MRITMAADIIEIKGGANVRGNGVFNMVCRDAEGQEMDVAYWDDRGARVAAETLKVGDRIMFSGKVRLRVGGEGQLTYLTVDARHVALLLSDM